MSGKVVLPEHFTIYFSEADVVSEAWDLCKPWFTLWVAICPFTLRQTAKMA